MSDELLHQLQHPSGEAREAALDSLAAPLDDGVVDVVRTLAVSDPDATVRRAALRALRRVQARHGAGQTALQALRDADWRVRDEALRVLDRVVTVSDIPPIIAHLRVAGDAAGTRLDALLRRFDSVEVARQLLGTDLSETIQVHVAHVLATLPGIDAVLLEARAAATGAPALVATLALGLRGNVEVRADLLGLLDSAAAHVRRLADEALRAHVSESPATLLAWAASDSERVRTLAAELLAAAPEGGRIASYLSAASNWRVRETCVRALGRVAEAGALSVLLATTRDEAFQVRRASIDALGANPLSSGPDGHVVVASLERLLMDRDEPLTRSVARSLAHIQSTEAGDVLERALGGGEPRVQRAVLEALTAPASMAHGLRLLGSLQQIAETADASTRARAFEVVTSIQRAATAAAPPRHRFWVEPEAAPTDEVAGGAPDMPGGEGAEQDAGTRGAIDARLSPDVPAARARYVDVTVFARTPRKTLTEWPRTQPLIHGRSYVLEVAVRQTVRGLASERPREPVAVPPKKVTLLVTMEGAAFGIEPAVATMTLESTGDSTANATFEVIPRQVSSDVTPVLPIEIRVYYRFNLVEAFTVHAEVAAGESTLPRTEGRDAMLIVQRRFERRLDDLDSYRPRHLHIDVAQTTSGFALAFACEDASGGAVALTATSHISADELEDVLVDYRKVLTELTVASPYVEKLTVSAPRYRDAVRALARVGRRAWHLLFPRTNPPLFKIGQALADTPPVAGSILQISIKRSAERFLFPWAVLFDRDYKDEPQALPDVDGFWGYRYLIEQQFSTPDLFGQPPDVTATTDCLKLAFALWDRFPNSSEQVALMEDYRQQAAGAIQLSGPLQTKAQFVRELQQADAQLFYFYTHGHARQRSTSTAQDGQIGAFLATYEALPAGAAGHQVFKELYRALKEKRYEVNDSWIEFSSGRLLYQEMLEEPLQFAGQPLVFLNMCESAQVLPTFAESFTDLFLVAGAGAVVGTECIMTTTFAHPFAKEFLDRLFAGANAGEALLHARRHFRDRRNPLGLAYTLFGSSVIAFPPPRLARAAANDAPPEERQ